MKVFGDYRIVIDQSTSATKLLLLHGGKIIKKYRKKHQQIFPRQGWVEHDPEEISANVKSLLNQLLTDNQLEAQAIKSISITNQRETIIVWDKLTGKPLYNAVVWQCNRSTQICNELIALGNESLISEKTGLRIDSYFSGTKIKWLVDHIPDIQFALAQERLAVGTMDSWLIWQLTDGEYFVTEPSNASRTLLYDIYGNCWDEDLAALFGVKLSALPEVLPSSATFGSYRGIPIIGVMADSQAALYGQGCLETGEIKITMGTGSSVMMQSREKANYHSSSILTTIAWKTTDQTFYALEGIIRSCGDSLNWLEENLAMFDDIASASNHVLSQNSDEEVFFIPALQGMGAPFWDQQMTAAFVGMRRSTKKEDLLRAVLESIIFQIKTVIDSMENLSETTIRTVKVDGGMINNHKLMEQLAALLNKNLELNAVEELSAIGCLKLTGAELSPELFSGETIQAGKSPALSVKYQKWLSLIH